MQIISIIKGALTALLLVFIHVPVAADTAQPDKTNLPAMLAQAVLADRAVASRLRIVRYSAQKRRPQTLVPIDAIARWDGVKLLDDLNALGLRGAERHGRLVSGHLPAHLLVDLEQVGSLMNAREAGTRFLAGATTTEGDRGMRSDIARGRFNVDGEGVTIGVISDSYDCLGGAMADVSSGDLPAEAQVLQEADNCQGKLDEGRALMQIIHDVAPGAMLVFRSGANGTAAVANAILELAEVGADIIIDDASVPTTSWFQYGPIARAAQQVEALGVVHVTAAGNEARLSYDSAYRASYAAALDVRAHDFDPGPIDDALQAFELPEGALLELVLQWDNPSFSNSGSPGATSDLDIYVTDESGTQLVGGAATDNMGMDPVEILRFSNPPDSGRTRFNLLIVTGAGPSPGRIKTIILGRFAGTITEHDTASSTIVGHANTAATIATAAVDHAFAFSENTGPPPLRFFSSAGGTPILFDSSGARYVEPIVIQKPDVAAPDGVATTFFRNDVDGPIEFIGTSASAPHVAGVVALLLQAREDLTPADVQAILTTSARDIVERAGDGPSFAGPGFDTDSGHGLIDAERALAIAGTFERLLPQSDVTVRPVIAEKAMNTGAVALSWLSVAGTLLMFRRSCCWLPRRSSFR